MFIHMGHIRGRTRDNSGKRKSLETTQAVATAGQFVSAREPGSRKGSRRSESAQAASTVAQVVCTRSTGRA